MKISRDVVRKVAQLARLSFSEDEESKLAEEMGSLLDHFEDLKDLDTTNVEATTHAVPLDCLQRADEMKPSDKASTLLDNAPRGKDNHFLVPKIIDA